MICKSKYFNEFTDEELRIGYDSMKKEMEHLPSLHPIKELFLDAWFYFSIGDFSYDGATFVKERNSSTLFEVAAFIHDWRNSNGYVGIKIDREFLCVMIVLNYAPELIKARIVLMTLTPINIARHRFLGTYKKEIPRNIFKL
jgi:hypothetical protein